MDSTDKLGKLAVACALFVGSSAHAKQAAETTHPSYTTVIDQATLPLLNPIFSERKVGKLILSNGLEVCLISDPDIKQSAAGLAVKAGSWQDPKEYPGMAHFLEHMLFMGNKAYPKEFEYMQFISDHGGMVNAYTAPDHTVYTFSVNNDAFASALDRFSHFFIDPLFLPQCINRELHAVDQEHAKNIENDGWRQYMILKETGNPKHPNCGFSTGNAQTLSGIPQEALKKWYHTYYSANQMYLVMMSSLPLEKMQALAIEDFSEVASISIPKTPITQELLSAKQKGHLIYIQPVRDLKQLSLLWEVPKRFASDIERKAPQLVAYALNQQGPNSLIETLKKEEIAEKLSATCDSFSDDTLLFSIDLSLTDYGVTHVNEAITRTFQAIARLKKEGIPQSLFDEMQTMAQLNYQYQSRDDAFSVVTQLTDALVYEDLATFPEKTAIPSHYDPLFIEQFIHSLDAKNGVYFVIADSKKTGVIPDKKERWMDAAYAIKDIPSTRLTAWNDAKPHADIQLPQANPFLPEHLALVALTGSASTPLLLHEDKSAQVYFAQDHEYLVPEIATVMTFKSPLINASAESQVLIDLYLRAFSEQLSSTLSFARRAHLRTQFSSDNLSLQLLVCGFSDKAPLLLQTLFETLPKVKPTAEQFEIYRASLASDYDNASKELPLVQAHEIMNNILLNRATNREKLKAAEGISYDSFLKFARELFTQTYTQALFYGNLTQSKAASLWQGLHARLNTTPYPLAEQPKGQILLLSKQKGPYMLTEQTERQGNGIVLVVEEGAYTFEKRGAQQILGAILKDAFFDTLRTKQQTAYIAQAFAVEKERQLLQYFRVQSNTHQPLELLGRFELFIEDFNKNIAQRVPQERFENVRSNIITLLKKPPENMRGKAMQLHDLAFEYEDFEWIDRRITSCEALTYERFTELSQEFLSRENSRRIAVLVEGVVPQENDFRYKLISKEQIHSLGSFVSANSSLAHETRN